MDLILKSLVLLSCQYSNWMAFCFNLDEMNLRKSHFHYNGIKPCLPLIYFDWMHIFRGKKHQLLAHKLENMDFNWWFLTQFFILFSRVVSHAFTLFLIRNICINELALSLGAHTYTHTNSSLYAVWLVWWMQFRCAIVVVAIIAAVCVAVVFRFHSTV